MDVPSRAPERGQNRLSPMAIGEESMNRMLDQQHQLIPTPFTTMASRAILRPLHFLHGLWGTKGREHHRHQSSTIAMTAP